MTLADFFLVALNSSDPGTTFAEALNGAGKTDLLIQQGGLTILIAELKIWAGRKSFARALQQLLSYTTWRDRSIAILPLIRVQDVTTAIQDAVAEIEKLPSWVSPSPQFDTSRMDFTLHATGDRRQLISLSLIPVPLVTSAQPRVGRPVTRRKRK